MRMKLRRMAGAAAACGHRHFGFAARCDLAGAVARTSSHAVSVLHIPARGNFPLAKRVSIGLGKSVLVQFPFELKDVLVSAPDKVDAVVQASNRVFLIAKKAGPDQRLLLRHQGPADPDAGDRRRRRPQGPRRHAEALRARIEHSGRDGRQSRRPDRHGAHAARRQARRRHRLPIRRRQQERRRSHQRLRSEPTRPTSRSPTKTAPGPETNTRPRPSSRPRPAAATPSWSSTCSSSRARSR